MNFSWLDQYLPRDPGKRDLVILALIAVPLVIIGVIWGALANDPASIHFPTTPLASPTPAG